MSEKEALLRDLMAAADLQDQELSQAKADLLKAREEKAKAEARADEEVARAEQKAREERAQLEHSAQEEVAQERRRAQEQRLQLQEQAMEEVAQLQRKVLEAKAAADSKQQEWSDERAGLAKRLAETVGGEREREEVSVGPLGREAVELVLDSLQPRAAAAGPASF